MMNVIEPIKNNIYFMLVPPPPPPSRVSLEEPYISLENFTVSPEETWSAKIKIDQVKVSRLKF